MFGLSIVRTKTLIELEQRERQINNLLYVRRWFSGWRDLDIIWEYILSEGSYSIESARMDYAEARRTDVYGKPAPGDK